LDVLWQEGGLEGIEEGGLPEGDAGIDIGGELTQQIEGGAIALVAVLSGDIEVAPVGCDFVEEVGAGAEGFPIEELVFTETMDGFDIAVVGVGGGGDEGVGDAAGFHGGLEAVRGAAPIPAAGILGAVIGLEAHLFEGHARGGEMIHDPLGEDAGEGGGSLLGVVGEGEAGADLSGGVLDEGQAQSFGLEPIMGDIVEVFGVMADLGEDRPLGFDSPQILLGDMLPFRGPDQASLAQDTGDGAFADRQLELDLEALGAEAGLVSQAHDAGFQAPGGAMGTGFGGMGAAGEAPASLGGEAAHPEPHRLGAGAQEAGGGLDADLAGGADQTQAQIIGIFDLSNHLRITQRRQHAASLAPTASCSPSPPGSAALCAARVWPVAPYTSAPPGGKHQPARSQY